MAKIKIYFKGEAYEIEESTLASSFATLKQTLTALSGGAVTPDIPDEPDVPEEPELGVDPTTGEILDSWEVIINNVNNGTYATKYAVGNYKPLDLSSQGIVNMQIAALDADVLSDGTGNARITWIAKELLVTAQVMNHTRTNAGGWEESSMRWYLSNHIYVLIPETVRNAIVAVDKTYYDYGYDEEYNYAECSTKTCSDKLWIPSYREVGFGTDVEDSSVVYSELFTDDASRIKTHQSTGTPDWWWLRSTESNDESRFWSVNYEGASTLEIAELTSGVVLSFCM
jgi:hypothetical protein